MADLGMSTQQWPHTCNANLAFKSVVNTFNQKELQEVFLETPTFATEKLDGTNVAKDDTGQIYSRRLKVGADKTHYQKTSLSQVREADIKKFRELLCSAGDIEGTTVSLCVVYGPGCMASLLLYVLGPAGDAGEVELGPCAAI